MTLQRYSAAYGNNPYAEDGMYPSPGGKWVLVVEVKEALKELPRFDMALSRGLAAVIERKNPDGEYINAHHLFELLP